MNEVEIELVKETIGSSVKEQFAKLPCKTHSLRIKIVEMIVYGAVGIILTIAFGAMVINLFPKAVHATLGIGG